MPLPRNTHAQCSNPQRSNGLEIALPLVMSGKVQLVEVTIANAVTSALHSAPDGYGPIAGNQVWHWCKWFCVIFNSHIAQAASSGSSRKDEGFREMSSSEDKTTIGRDGTE